METETNPQIVKQVCTIQIAFPVETDEQAITYKKKITEVLADISQARIEFSLMSLPPRNNPNARTTNNI